MIARSVPSYPRTVTSRTPGRCDSAASNSRSASMLANGPASRVTGALAGGAGSRRGRDAGTSTRSYADEQLAHRRHEPLAELGERLDLVAGVERRRRDRRRLWDGRRFGGRWRRWRLRGGRLRRRLGERRGRWRGGRRRVGGRRRDRGVGDRQRGVGNFGHQDRARVAVGGELGLDVVQEPVQLLDDAPPECSLVRSTRTRPA